MLFVLYASIEADVMFHINIAHHPPHGLKSTLNCSRGVFNIIQHWRHTCDYPTHYDVPHLCRPNDVHFPLTQHMRL